VKTARITAVLVAAGALLALGFPVVIKPLDGNHGKGATKRCAKTHGVGYTVGGTLVSFTADDPQTQASEATVTLKVTHANSHARKSGEIADQDANKKGVQVKGAEYTVPAGDAFKLKLRGYTGADTPSVGDKVQVVGKVPVTKRKCAAPGTSDADRYGTPNIRKVSISDRDPDA